jgi:glycosyltransferase involved in cell wall biosynthesis
VVLADNGSSDGTAEAAAARGAVVVHEPQPGYGAACLAALDWIGSRETPPEAVVFLDADLADDPATLPRLLAPLEAGGPDREDAASTPALVLGSRVRLAEPGALNLVQRFGNALACSLMLVLGGRRYSDLGPFRVVTWSALQRMRMADRTWGWTVEMQMKAALLGIPSVEVDVPYRRRPHGRSKISGTVRGVVKAGTKIIYTIFKLRVRARSLRHQ